jgi:hypothetical protein
MNFIRILFALMAGLVCHAAIAAEAEKPAAAAKPMEQLDTAIPHGIALLEASKFKEFLETFATPEDLKKMKEVTSLDELAKRFGKDRAPNVIAVLKAIKDAKPKLEDDGKKATYPIPENLAETKQSIVFIRVGTAWYIED